MVSVDGSNVNRAFLQACGRRSVLPLNESKKILASILDKYGEDGQTANDGTLRQVVDEINAKFVEKKIDQALCFVYLELDDHNNEISSEFLVMCNKFTKVGLSPAYNESECAYFKSLVEKLIISDTHKIPLMSAIYLCTQTTQSQSISKKVTKQRAEELLDEWSAAGYFFTTDGESLTLGPKAIGEFRSTIRSKFNNYVQICHLCDDLVLTPKYCPNDDCEVSLDRRCFRNYVTSKKKCPKCKTNWED